MRRLSRTDRRPGAAGERSLLVLPLLLSLSGCGDLPQPFAENPGGDAPRLSVPPPSRLDVPVPAGALLAEREARIWSDALTVSLLQKEVPAVAQPVRRGDWHLEVTARLRDGEVLPTYRIVGPNGRVQASEDGTPVPAGSWVGADAALLRANAALAAAQVNAMLSGIQAREAQADPNSLLNRVTRIRFTGVSGAPGNGDVELARQMAVLLPDEHDTLQTDAKHADYTVSGHVTVSAPDPKARNMQHVEITWTVVNARGHEAGKATQLHDVPAHALDGFWGDVAVAAAQEASGGIHEVISNNEGKPHVQPPPAS